MAADEAVVAPPAGTAARDQRLGGDLKRLKGVEIIDQNPIGKSLRSNPVTYLKAYDDIRKLFADQPYAKHNGLTPSHFSFNMAGGRCEECQGEGVIKVGMQFMADVELVCESCGGKRFKDEVLEVKYHGHSIYDILELTVDAAVDLFAAYQDKDAINKKIIEKLKTLQDVGLGYVKLGQSSSTLSGALLARGHTVVIVEHNMDVIRSADWVIDLGPEAGERGGRVVFEGTPADLMTCRESYTGKFLSLAENSRRGAAKTKK